MPSFFFYGETKIDTDSDTLMGAQIKDLIASNEVPDFDPSHALVLEGHGNEADRPIGDDEVVNLNPSDGGVKHFFSQPPSDFGVLD